MLGPRGRRVRAVHCELRMADIANSSRRLFHQRERHTRLRRPPIIGAGYVIGLGAIAITRFIFPRSSIKVVLAVVVACAGLVALPLLALSKAISGTPTTRDLGAVAMLLAVPLGIATWAVISSYRPKREAR